MNFINGNNNKFKLSNWILKYDWECTTSTSRANFLCFDTVVSENIDKESFEVIYKSNLIYSDIIDAPERESRDILAKDKNNVYSAYGKINADSKSFTPIDYYYSKDKNNIYSWVKWEKLKEADIDTFKILSNYGLAKDKNFVYLQWTILRKIDANSIKYLWWHYYKDKNGVYYKSEIIRWVDKETFESLWGAFWKDKSRVFYWSEYIPWADSKSMVYVNYLYGKDKKHVYYMENPIVWASPDSFEKIWNSLYFKDKNKIYFWGKATKADVNTFEATSINEWKDKNWRYKYWQSL